MDNMQFAIRIDRSLFRHINVSSHVHGNPDTVPGLRSRLLDSNLYRGGLLTAL